MNKMSKHFHNDSRQLLVLYGYSCCLLFNAKYVEFNCYRMGKKGKRKEKMRRVQEAGEREERVLQYG